MIQSNRAWFTVEEAARILRIRRNSLYEACASGDFPCERFGGTNDKWFIRIPCEALRMRLAPAVKARSYNIPEDSGQLELPLDPACLIPVRRFRNTREIVEPFHYESALYAQRVKRV